MTSGKRAIKNNERNWPVKQSIRIVKEARADADFEEQVKEAEEQA